MHETNVLVCFIRLSLMLKPERFLVCECQVRALFDDSRKQVDEAGPSTPVQVYLLVIYV